MKSIAPKPQTVDFLQHFLTRLINAENRSKGTLDYRKHLKKGHVFGHV